MSIPPPGSSPLRPSRPRIRPNALSGISQRSQTTAPSAVRRTRQSGTARRRRPRPDLRLAAPADIAVIVATARDGALGRTARRLTTLGTASSACGGPRSAAGLSRGRFVDAGNEKGDRRGHLPALGEIRRGRLPSRAGAELAKDVLDVPLDRELREPEALGNLLVGSAVRDEPEHFELATRECGPVPRHTSGCACALQSTDQQQRDVPPEGRLTIDRSAQRAEKSRPARSPSARPPLRPRGRARRRGWARGGLASPTRLEGHRADEAA